MTAFADIPADAADCYAWAEKQWEINPEDADGIFEMAETIAWTCGAALPPGAPMPAEFVGKPRLELGFREGQAHR